MRSAQVERATHISSKRSGRHYCIGAIDERIKDVGAVVHVLQRFDILDWRSENQGRQNHSNAVAGVFPLNVIPYRLFGQLLTGTIGNVRILSLDGIFIRNLLIVRELVLDSIRAGKR